MAPLPSIMHSIPWQKYSVRLFLLLTPVTVVTNGLSCCSFRASSNPVTTAFRGSVLINSKFDGIRLDAAALARVQSWVLFPDAVHLQGFQEC